MYAIKAYFQYHIDKFMLTITGGGSKHNDGFVGTTNCRLKLLPPRRLAQEGKLCVTLNIYVYWSTRIGGWIKGSERGEWE